jgi:hypothetical protein
MGTIMKNYMIIKQRVSDLARFQQAFDHLKPERSKAGLTDLGQFCAVEDPNTVIVVLGGQTAWISYIDNRIEAALAHQGLSELQMDVIGRFGGRIRAQLRDEFKAAIDGVRSLFEAKLAEYRERVLTTPGKLPASKIWHPETVTYEGEVTCFEGSLYQARKDTAQIPTGSDWICVARAGRDGRTPKVCGPYDARKAYAQLDIVQCDGASFVAKRDDPGECPGDDGEMLAARGKAGETIVGPRGPSGKKGERGEPGRDGCDGRTPKVCGTYDVRKSYARLDIVACDGASFIARRDDPGPCPRDGWQMLASRGKAGDKGQPGPRGEKGERPARGAIGASPDYRGRGASPAHPAGRASAAKSPQPSRQQAPYASPAEPGVYASAAAELPPSGQESH